MAFIEDAKHFQQFSKLVEQKIQQVGKDVDEKAVLEQQKQQVEALSRLENEWRLEVISSGLATEVYTIFIDYILKEKHNTLVARPFFRERQESFTSKIGNPIKNGDIKVLQECHVNFHFISLIMGKVKGTPKMCSIYEQIKDARKQLIVLNLPLAINRATIFFRCSQKSHLSFMDMVQIAAEGLINGVDKFCGTYEKIWRGMTIGRMVGNLISDSSETLIHFYPGDKRRLYRARKFMARHAPGDYDIEDLVKAVNTKPAEALKSKTPKKKKSATESVPKVTKEELLDLLGAASVLSIDNKNTTEDGPKFEYEAPKENRPDVIVENMDVQRRFDAALKQISVFDRKILVLKGLDLEDNR